MVTAGVDHSASLVKFREPHMSIYREKESGLFLRKIKVHKSCYIFFSMNTIVAISPDQKKKKKFIPVQCHLIQQCGCGCTIAYSASSLMMYIL